MTLSTRVSLFFLTMLALVLIGFSVTLHFLAAAHLHGQVQQRLDGALNTLVAAAEFGPNGLEWEPNERQVRLGNASGDAILWLVRDPADRILDQPPFTDGPGLEDFFALYPDQELSSIRPWSREGQQWLVLQRILRSESIRKEKDPERKQGHEGPVYASLSVTVAASLEPVRQAIWLLDVTLGLLCLGVWLVSLFVGRSVLRQALLPVTKMATAVQEMDGVELHQRLPVTQTGDELQVLGEGFNALLARVEESFERQRRFTADASHQLRTPLAAILGQIEVALRKDRDLEEYRRVLTTVHARTNHLGKMVEALLFLARANNDAALPDCQGLELGEWLAALVNSSEHPRRSDFQLNNHCSHPVHVQVPPLLLGELVHILLDNAAKFSAAGTPIQVQLVVTEERARLSVEDRGHGISEKDIKDIFTPFFRSTDARRRGLGGTGLGLAIGRRLAEVCGGKLTVRSRVDEGSCFTLELPLILRQTVSSGQAVLSLRGDLA